MGLGGKLVGKLVPELIYKFENNPEMIILQSLQPEICHSSFGFNHHKNQISQAFTVGYLKVRYYIKLFYN